MNYNIIDLVETQKILPILRGDNTRDIIDKAQALVEGGIDVLEVNSQSPDYYRMIYEISKFSKVCAGGIISSIQAQNALDSGAVAVSSPIFQMNLVKFSKDKHIPLIASASTANEAYNAWKARVPFVKIYPVTPLGGVLYIKDLLRPMPFLKVIPLGNVKLNEIKQYIDAGAVSVGVGRDLYEGYTYREITDRTRDIIERLS